MGIPTMSVGPTQRLFQRARNWAGDVEELSTLQWQLFQLELSGLTSELKRSIAFFAASIGLVTLGLPLAVIAGLVMLAQAMEWPIANVLTAAGVIFMVLSIPLWLTARRAWSAHTWFPRSRRQATQNWKSVFAQLNSRDEDELADDSYYPD
jgi:hypothetical protein